MKEIGEKGGWPVDPNEEEKAASCGRRKEDQRPEIGGETNEREGNKALSRTVFRFQEGRIARSKKRKGWRICEARGDAREEVEQGWVICIFRPRVG